jgi:hypothetical protein
MAGENDDSPLGQELAKGVVIGHWCPRKQVEGCLGDVQFVALLSQFHHHAVPSAFYCGDVDKKAVDIGSSTLSGQRS